MSDWKPITVPPQDEVFTLILESFREARVLVWVDDTHSGGWREGRCLEFNDGRRQWMVSNSPSRWNITHYMVIDPPGATA